MDNRAGCFEWFGLDFMVDVDLHVWNLECNISPDLSRGTEVAHPFSVFERELGKMLRKQLRAMRHIPRLPCGHRCRLGPDW